MEENIRMKFKVIADQILIYLVAYIAPSYGRLGRTLREIKIKCAKYNHERPTIWQLLRV